MSLLKSLTCCLLGHDITDTPETEYLAAPFIYVADCPRCKQRCIKDVNIDSISANWRTTTKRELKRITDYAQQKQAAEIEQEERARKREALLRDEAFESQRISAIAYIKAAQLLNEALLGNTFYGSDECHAHQRIAAQLHDALTALGN